MPDSRGESRLPTLVSLQAGERLRGLAAVPSALDRDTTEILAVLATNLSSPVALLSRGPAGWRFEGEAFPSGGHDRAEPTLTPPVSSDYLSTGPWTGVFVGRARRREWLLVMPGAADNWQATAGLEDVIERMGRRLEKIAQADDEQYLDRVGRRLFAFVRRLSRTTGSERTHRLVLRTMARVVHANTAAFAFYVESEQALAITASIGYPQAIVEHLRIQPGEGVIGEAFNSGRVMLGRADHTPRRLRYRTDSYLAIPLVTSGRPIAVITLTDKADGRPFDDRDLAAVRMFAAPAALALARERVSEDLDELTRAATVDAVTGLFNRRYFETRLQAEVQRARRQGQDLALLMVDIDDFKRINDTFGHLEGDRALREVADLLRGGVRIFDVCARYGGEEFAIVMPGASEQMAIQVAERIRRGIDDRSRLQPLPVTVSVGVGFLRPGGTAEELVAAADSALIRAKRAGKNVVKAEGLRDDL